MKKLLFLTAILILNFNTLVAQMIDTKLISLSDAQIMANAALDRAKQDNWTVVIAIVDAGGHLILLNKIDNTQIGSIDVAIKKAKAAASFKRSTKVFQDGLAAGNTNILALPGAIPYEGGLPIFYNGIVIGAIGVSGVTAAQDGIIAQAAIDALGLDK
jgi:glc operon protein GlcG